MDATALSVLLVDDNHDGADALAMLVESYGYPTRIVYSAAAARQAVADGFRPDVLILDVFLGPDSGYDLARDLCRQTTPAALVGRDHGPPRATGTVSGGGVRQPLPEADRPARPPPDSGRARRGSPRSARSAVRTSRRASRGRGGH